MKFNADFHKRACAKSAVTCLTCHVVPVLADLCAGLSESDKPPRRVTFDAAAPSALAPAAPPLPDTTGDLLANSGDKKQSEGEGPALLQLRRVAVPVLLMYNADSCLRANVVGPHVSTAGQSLND